ncbi:MAG: transposase [Candidatus Methylomirabilia bacterium]
MIGPDQHAEIRRLFYAEHWPVGTIASALGVHPDTVRRAIERERFARLGTRPRPSALDPYKPFITATLEQYPRLRATRLSAMLRERGYPGSAVQVRRYVRTVRPLARTEAYLRLETLPGELGGQPEGRRPQPAASGADCVDCYLTLPFACLAFSLRVQ